jgi:hypothetical protein
MVKERVKMSEKIYYGEDGKRIEAKGAKLEEILQMQAEAQEAQKLFEAEQQAKEEAKASAMAKLATLGLTDEEISALIQ